MRISHTFEAGINLFPDHLVITLNVSYTLAWHLNKTFFTVEPASHYVQCAALVDIVGQAVGAVSHIFCSHVPIAMCRVVMKVVSWCLQEQVASGAAPQ